jgi:hypothetical protein
LIDERRLETDLAVAGIEQDVAVIVYACSKAHV